MPGPAATRPSNKNKHTALEAKKVTQSRRPTQEVQAEKHAKEQEKIQKEGKKKAGQIEAARLEQEAREKANALKAKVSRADHLNIPHVCQQRPGASRDSGGFS